MIPKIIHYCWFGGKPLPEEAQKCINSWKKFCPDYEIKEWNESNYDINKCLRMKQAYEVKKWGFVPDYARADIIYNNGGIYLDTDVEMIKSFDDLLNYKSFFGWGKPDTKQYEGEIIDNTINCGQGFGSEKGSLILKEIMDLFDKTPFIKNDNTLDLTPAPAYETKIIEKFGFDSSNTDFQEKDGVVVLPPDYLCPMEYRSGNLELTENTHSIHWFSMSWMTPKEQYYKKLEWKYAKKYGYEKAYKIVRRKSFFYRAFRKLKKILFKSR